jgi:hypothetical protein
MKVYFDVYGFGMALFARRRWYYPHVEMGGGENAGEV